MLSQSLQIKTYTTNLNTYQASGQIYNWAETLAKLIRSVVDFESSNGAGLKTDYPSLKESPNIKGYIEDKEDEGYA